MISTSIHLYLKKIFEYSLKEYLKVVILPCIVFSVLVIIIPYIITVLFPPSFIRLVLVGITSVLLSIIIAYMVILNSSEKGLVKKMINRK